MVTFTTTRRSRARLSVLVSGCMTLLCLAATAGCGTDRYGEPVIADTDHEAALREAGQEFSWADSGGTVDPAKLAEAEKVCRQEIKDATTDQIQQIPYDKIRECLIKKGWHRVRAK